MSTFTPITIDSSLLLNYYSAQLTSDASTAATTNFSASGSSSSTSSGNSFGQAATVSASTPPWDIPTTLTAQQEAAQVLATTNFIQSSSTPLTATAGTSASTAADNQKLFTLYQAVNQLSQLANVASQSGVSSGVLAGYNTQFQTGLQQVESYISSTSFNNLTLQSQTPSASVTGTATVPLPPYQYQGSTIVSDANYDNPLPGVSASDSFNIGVTKGGTTTNLNIDLSQVQGPLTISNIVNYMNQQLSAAGFSSTVSVQMTSGSISDEQDASFGIAIDPAPGESLNLSSASAKPTLYLASTGGSTTGTPANSVTGQAAVAPDNQGTITALTNISSGTLQSVFNATEAPTTGTTTAQDEVVDGQGNVYVVGDATGNMGGQLNQGTQDVYLSKYDSAGNLQWSTLLGSAGSASAYSLALNPSTGGVVVAGSTTAALSTTAVSDGNTDSFVASYDTNGNQLWEQQIPTIADNQANAITVDSQGNVTIGGSVQGSLGSGQTSTGTSNAYLAQLDSSGNITSENEFGPTGTSSVAAMATASDGGLIVASVQNGDAILSKYASGTISGTPEWEMDLGSLNGGSIGGLAVSGNQVYVSGTTSNTALTANGQASVAVPSSGSSSAFVFDATDNGSTVNANTVSYISAPSGSTSGAGLTVGSDGTVYLAGTTTGTFAGQTRTVANANNAFVAALSPGGTIDWTQQYGGADGQSTGSAVAINPTGSSVLNALGLPSGTININQSVDLTSETTVRAGDSFQLQTEGTGGRTSTITITQGETLQDLAVSINAELLSAGTATVTYSATGGQTLKITASAGNSINLIAGPADSDALGRLGLAAGTITAPAKKGSTKSSSSSTASPGATTTSFGIQPAGTTSTSTTKQAFGLGLDTSIDLLSSGDAGVAKISLQNVLNTITNIYQKTNTSASASSAASTLTAQQSAPAPAYLTQQVAGYSLALAAFAATNSLASTTSSSSSSSSNSALYQALLSA